MSVYISLKHLVSMSSAFSQDGLCEKAQLHTSDGSLLSLFSYTEHQGRVVVSV